MIAFLLSEKGLKRILNFTTAEGGTKALTGGLRIVFTGVHCLRRRRQYEQAAYHL